MLKEKVREAVTAPREAPPPNLPMPMPPTLADARHDLAVAEQAQDWLRAAALKYGAIPYLEQQSVAELEIAPQLAHSVPDEVLEVPAPPKIPEPPSAYDLWKQQMAAQIGQTGVHPEQLHETPKDLSTTFSALWMWGLLGWIPTILAFSFLLSHISPSCGELYGTILGTFAYLAGFRFAANIARQ